MPGLTDWFDVFRCGTHTDRFGREVTITRADIDRAILSYQKDSAPIVVGHPPINAPAFGWIGAFRRVGDIVQAKASSVADEFADLVKRHLYKNRSLAFGPGLRFRHVGFLGAQPPAVKGLQDIQFNREEEFMDVEFSESANTPAAPESAFPAAGNSDSPAPESLPKTEAEQQPEAEKAEDKKDEQVSLKAVLAEMSAVKERLQAADAKVKQLEADNAKLQSDYSAASRELRQNEFSAYADELIAGGRLAKEQRGQLLEFMECLHGFNNYEFAEGSMPVLQRFKDLFKAVSKHPVQFAEFASSDKAAVSQDLRPEVLAQKAREIIENEAKSGRVVSASEAVDRVIGGQNHA